MKGIRMWNAILTAVLGAKVAMDNATQAYVAAQGDEAGGISRSYRGIKHRSQAKKRRLRRQRNQY